MNAHGGISVTTHQTRQIIGFSLGLYEYENFVMRLAAYFFKKSGQFLFLLVFFADINDLQDVVVGMQVLRTNVDVGVVN